MTAILARLFVTAQSHGTVTQLRHRAAILSCKWVELCCVLLICFQGNSIIHKSAQRD